MAREETVANVGEEEAGALARRERRSRRAPRSSAAAARLRRGWRATAGCGGRKSATRQVRRWAKAPTLPGARTAAVGGECATGPVRWAFLATKEARWVRSPAKPAADDDDVSAAAEWCRGGPENDDDDGLATAPLSLRPPPCPSIGTRGPSDSRGLHPPVFSCWATANLILSSRRCCCRWTARAAVWVCWARASRAASSIF